MKSLLINPRTKKQLDSFLSKPSQALLITGPKGSGKTIIAKKVAIDLLKLQSEKSLETYPYFIQIQKDEGKKNISIEQVRELIKNIKLKIPGKQDTRRVVFIESAQDLNDESANAILKILEEPSKETIYILSSHSSSDLPATIVSRCQIINVNPINQVTAQKLLQDDYQLDLIDSAWRLSEGRPGLMLALLSKDMDHPLKKAIENAKNFINQTTYQRIIKIDELVKNKDDLADFLEGLNRVLGALTASSVAKQNHTQSKKIIKSRRLVQELDSALKNNASSRLILLRLSINLVR